jgi:hypothetical protein
MLLRRRCDCLHRSLPPSSCDLRGSSRFPAIWVYENGLTGMDPTTFSVPARWVRAGASIRTRLLERR